MPATERNDRAERFIRASPANIYAAFIDREAVLKWLPPEGSHATIEAFEPRPGGSFKMRLVFDSPGQGKSDANSDLVNGTFEELIPNRAVTQRFQFDSDDPRFAGTMTMSWTFEREGEGTRVSVVARNVPQGIKALDHEKGMASSLANLARLLGERSS